MPMYSASRSATRWLVLTICLCLLPCSLLSADSRPGLAQTGLAQTAEQTMHPARRAAQEPQVLARIGDQVILADDFVAELRQRITHDPQVATAEGRRSLLHEMVRHRALVLQAEQAGYAERPEIVAAYERLLVAAYQRNHHNPRLDALTVSDDEVAAHYAAHAQDYAIPARFRAAIIFYRVAAEAQPEIRAQLEHKARTGLAEVAQLDPSVLHFGQLALRDSDHRESRYQGGVIGWLSPTTEAGSRWPPELLQAIFAFERPGQTAGPIVTDKGLYLVRLVAKEEGRSQSLEQVADGIRRRLLEEKRAALRRSFDDELVAELGISLGVERLQALELPDVDTRLAPPAVPETANRPSAALPNPKPGS